MLEPLLHQPGMFSQQLGMITENNAWLHARASFIRTYLWMLENTVIKEERKNREEKLNANRRPTNLDKDGKKGFPLEDNLRDHQMVIKDFNCFCETLKIVQFGSWTWRPSRS
jgi:hypothetical protein